MDMVFDFFDSLLDLVANLKTFLFSEVTVFDYTFTCWELIGSGLLITLLIAAFVKIFV